MVQIILHTALVSLVLMLTVYGQNNVSVTDTDINDEELVKGLAAEDPREATKTAIEIFNRGERILPLLIKLKGNRVVFSGYCLGDPLAAMGTLGPHDDATSEEIKSNVRAGRYVTNEVVALYLISAIYYDNLAFAQVPYLTGNKRVKDYKYNTPNRIEKAWTATERWHKRLEKEGLEQLREEKEAPLSSSEVHFYGTEPTRVRELSDCGM
jgi:hypothetical protein